ncbi:hypothetical protein DY240_13245 [Jiangella rhizosphaerae]|uniref:Uncharacterized protein n=1 Tax=Jiangella rhizosphaerae TaxID=2293569 RepID=A0A418KR10_9ACTN|nr:hypothetical protein DY240_13245 [Jiangella rhizosphaerae]
MAAHARLKRTEEALRADADRLTRAHAAQDGQLSGGRGKSGDDAALFGRFCVALVSLSVH